MLAAHEPFVEAAERGHLQVDCGPMEPALREMHKIRAHMEGIEPCPITPAPKLVLKPRAERCDIRSVVSHCQHRRITLGALVQKKLLYLRIGRGPTW